MQFHPIHSPPQRVTEAWQYSIVHSVSIPVPGSVSQSVYRNSTTEALYVQNANKLDRSQVKVCKLQDAKLIPRTP